MIISRLAAAVGLSVISSLANVSLAQGVLQTENLRLEVGRDGTLRSLIAKAAGDEYACHGERIRCYVFRRATQPGDTYALLWAVQGEMDLVLPVAAKRVTMMRPFGNRLAVSPQAGKAVITAGSRMYLRLKGMSTQQAMDTLRQGSQLCQAFRCGCVPPIAWAF